MRRYLLSGKVTNGMFPNERVVLFSDFQGRDFPVMVPDYAIVRMVGEEGTVEVKLIQESGDVALVVLPGEALGSVRIITVKGSQLQFQENGSRNGDSK